jgi:hypothetical protein
MSVFKHFYNLLTVVLLCLAFIGQSLASTVMSYEMLSHAMNSPMGNGESSAGKMANCMENMSHISKNISANVSANMANDLSESLDEETVNKCCSDMCHCFTAGCASTIVLLQYTHHIVAPEHGTKIQRPSALIFNQAPSSLYRPPIITA